MKCNEMIDRSRQVCSIQEKIVMARRDGPKVLYLDQISINNGIYYLKEHHDGCRSLFRLTFDKNTNYVLAAFKALLSY